MRCCCERRSSGLSWHRKGGGSIKTFRKRALQWRWASFRGNSPALAWILNLELLQKSRNFTRDSSLKQCSLQSLKSNWLEFWEHAKGVLSTSPTAISPLETCYRHNRTENGPQKEKWVAVYIAWGCSHPRTHCWVWWLPALVQSGKMEMHSRSGDGLWLDHGIKKHKGEGPPVSIDSMKWPRWMRWWGDERRD